MTSAQRLLRAVLLAGIALLLAGEPAIAGGGSQKRRASAHQASAKVRAKRGRAKAKRTRRQRSLRRRAPRLTRGGRARRVRRSRARRLRTGRFRREHLRKGRLRAGKRLRFRSRLRHQRRTRPSKKRFLSEKAADRFLKKVMKRERRFYKPGVAWDKKTGLTYDGHPVDFDTGELRDSARNWSAASKESLHIAMLVKAIEGDPTAQELLTPDPADPSQAAELALDVLERKISTYETFNRENPGFGGFLPWFSSRDGKMVPSTEYWVDKVPGLDNGQLAWSLYVAAHSLADRGHEKLSRRYRSHFDLMRKNVVRMFYDRKAQHFRAETRIARTDRRPEQNTYTNPQKGYLLDDAYEGLMLVHFADLFGKWGKDRRAREKIWRTPRRRPRTYERDGRRITVTEGHWFSSHEAWGFLVLPFRDHALADRLFLSDQKVRTLHSAREGHSGLFASTQKPVRENASSFEYLSAAGIQQVAKEKVQRGEPVFAPYAAFPLALANKRVFATWMRSMLYKNGKPRKGVFGPLGIGESYTDSGKSTPVVTWDGKGLIAIALMGGITGEVRSYLKRDGKYEAFLRRVREDHRAFEGVRLEGESESFRAPPPSGAD